jgi:hypothetical protein
MANLQSRQRETDARDRAKSEASTGVESVHVRSATPEHLQGRFGNNLAAIPAFPSLAASPAYLPTVPEVPNTGRPTAGAHAGAASTVPGFPVDQYPFGRSIFPASSDIYNLDSRGPGGAPDTMMLPEFWAEVVSVMVGGGYRGVWDLMGTGFCSSFSPRSLASR